MTRAEPAANGKPLTVRLKLIYAGGDHTVNLALSALSLLYLFYLIQVAGLRPALAGAVPLVGRLVDAFTDPLMGRLSDRTRWKLGRRRPYFLLGAIPFGASFAVLWSPAPFSGQWEMFAYYTCAYILFSVSVTVVSVPYLALLPEMALDYDERTSFNTYRSAAAILGTFAAVLMDRFTQALGKDQAGFSETGILFGIWLVVPWIFVYASSFERPSFQRGKQAPLLDSVKSVLRHGSYRRLCALFLFARIAVDITGAMFKFFFVFWLLRPEDFRTALSAMLLSVVVSLPFWLSMSRRTDKRSLFIFGALWWIAIQFVLLSVTPEWPAWTVIAVAAVAGIGYAVADLMPWSMLGDVIDEDELISGERREGLYAGFFTFLRKLGGATGVFLAGIILDGAGFTGEGPQSESALFAIRGLTALAPAFFLALAAWLALRYPLSRSRHQEIRRELDARRESCTDPGA